MIDIAILIAITISLTEFAKRTFKVDKRYLPAISLFIGLIASVLYLDMSIKLQIAYGLMIGLSASGLFDQSKIVKGDKHD